MSQLSDYIRAVSYYDFRQVFFNDLDILALTEIAYLSFDKVMGPDEDLNLEQLANLYKDKVGLDSSVFSVTTKARVQLFLIMAAQPRYKHVRIKHLRQELDERVERQFGALTYQIGQTHLIIYRGTDENLIGWKEDFKMAFKETVPAQASALDYLKDRMADCPGKFILSGHSKGGNLAIYAATFMGSDQLRISSIYAFDAPGLHKSIVTSGKFLAIRDKIKSYIPQDSLVAMILENPVPTIRVKSKAFWLLQHDTFTWELDYFSFVKPTFPPVISTATDQYLEEFIARTSEEELESFFDLVFDLFLAADIHKFTDISIDTPKKVMKLAKSMTGVSAEQLKLAGKIVMTVFQAGFGTVRSQLPGGKALDSLPKLP